MAELPFDLGPITDDGRAEDRVLEQLKLFLPTLVPLFDEAAGRPEGATPVPHPERGYFVRSTNTRWAEETPPALVVVSPGTLGDPELHGPRGTVAQWQQVNVTVTTGGAKEEGARRKAQILIAAVQMVLLRAVPGDIVTRVRPLGKRYDLLTPTRQRQAAGVRAALYVPNVVDTRGSFPTDPAQTTYVVPDSSRVAVERTVTPIPEASP